MPVIFHSPRPNSSSSSSFRMTLIKIQQRPNHHTLDSLNDIHERSFIPATMAFQRCPFVYLFFLLFCGVSTIHGQIAANFRAYVDDPDGVAIIADNGKYLRYSWVIWFSIYCSVFLGKERVCSL